VLSRQITFILQKYPPKLLILLLLFFRVRKVIYETDDATWQEGSLGELYFKRILKISKAVIVENSKQANFIKQHYLYSNLIVWPTPSESEFIPLKIKRNNLMTIAWVGSYSTSFGIVSLAKVLAKLHESTRFNLILLGISTAGKKFYESLFPQEYLNILQSYNSEIMHRELSLSHIGLFPKTGSPLDDFRGNHKIKVYSSAGLHVVSDVKFQSQMEELQGICISFYSDSEDFKMQINEVQRRLASETQLHESLAPWISSYYSRTELARDLVYRLEHLGLI